MKHLFASVLIVGICGVLLAGCNPIANISKRERYTQLEAVTNTYRKLMRWGHYDQAAQYLRTREDDQEQPDLKLLDRYKVTSFSIGEQLIADSQVDARVTAYIEFYNVDSGVASGVTDIQFWWYDEEAKRWFLGSPMVNFADFE